MNNDRVETEDVERLLKEARCAMILGMNSAAAGLFRRLAVEYQRRATNSRLAPRDVTTKIEFEPLGDMTAHDLPLYLRRQAE